jgi:multidrug transporter EmrE-like cation transporter
MVAQSWRAWSAVACLLLTFGFWMLVLRRAKLSQAFPVTALTFIGVLGGSSWFFGETIAPIQYAGIALIVAGVAVLKPLDT